MATQRTKTDHAAPIGAPRAEQARPPTRIGMPAGRVLIVMLVCLLMWTLLFAPELERAAEAQPLGARRTVSLAVLAPFVWLSDATRLTGLTEDATTALGRAPDDAPGGSPEFPVDELPPVTPGPSVTPSPPPTVDTSIRVPTPKDRLRVAVVGDSLAAGVGYHAERVFRPALVDVTKQGRISTGLARPDYYDWPTAMRRITDTFRPDLVIVLIGKNDNQPLLTRSRAVEAPIGTTDWPPAYEARVERFAKIATRGGAHVVWIGLPVERDESRWPFVRRLNDIYETVADALPNVTYLDSWDLFDRPDGSYTAYYRIGERIELSREGDGVHFTSVGYTILMQHVAQAATEEFDLDPKTYET